VQNIGHLSLLVAVRTHRVAMQLTGLCNSMIGGTICSNQMTLVLLRYPKPTPKPRLYAETVHC